MPASDKDLEGIPLLQQQRAMRIHRAHTFRSRWPLASIAAFAIFFVWGFALLSSLPSVWNGQAGTLDGINAWLHRLSPYGKAPLPHDNDVDWDAISTGTLTEIQCWDDQERKDPPGTHCYRLLLPLDYTNLSDARRASIAVVRYEAGGGKTPRDQVIGTVFINPGGPGGSGINHVRQVCAGHTAFKEYDDTFEGRYDIASWDPRDVQRTWPRADCYGDGKTKYLNDLHLAGADLFHASTGAIPHQLASHHLLSRLCEAKQGDSLTFVTTASTARDLRALYRAFGDDKLNLGGFSYGTAIGSVFAAMFPEEVGRFWLDGVLDVPNYLSQGEYDMREVDQVIHAIFTECALAGPGRCELAKSLTDEQRELPDKGGSILWQRLLDKLEALRKLPQPEARAQTPQLLTYLVLKNALYNSVFSPGRRWPDLTRKLAAGFERDDWSSFLDEHGTLEPYQPSQYPDALYNFEDISNYAIAYADFMEDAGDEASWTPERVQREIEQLEEHSPIFAEIGGLGTGSWYTRGKDLWYGGYNATPATPILFASTDLDPVTPLHGAKTMARLFKGSHLLRVQGGIGHGTFGAPSACVAKHVSNWMVRGILPPQSHPPEEGEAPETICLPDAGPYDPKPEGGVPALATEEQERAQRVYAAHVALGERLADAGLHGRLHKGRRARG